LERGDIAITFKGDLLCPFLQYKSQNTKEYISYLNAAVKCSGEEINLADCVQLTEGGVYANMTESVSSRGWGLSICDIQKGKTCKLLALRHFRLFCLSSPMSPLAFGLFSWGHVILNLTIL